MKNELDILKEVCLRLDNFHIAYMLTGSFAANLYATPRMTRDIDFVIEIQTKDVEKIFNIFQQDFYIEKNSVGEAIKHMNMFNIIHNELALKIDFIIRKNQEYRLKEFSRRKIIILDDTPISIVSLEDLIISKLFWGKDHFSEMQIKDVKNLLSSLHRIDYDYIDEWIAKLNLKSMYEKVKDHE